MTLRRVTPAIVFPISVAEAKSYLRVERSDEDALIGRLIASAFAHIEMTTGRFFVPQTWELVLDMFPAGEIKIPLGPVASVESVSYVDADGFMDIVPAEDYEVDTVSEEGWIVPVGSWPTPMETINAVVIRFVVGGETMQEDVRHAALLLIGHGYETRAAATETPRHVVPLAFESMVGLHRRYYV